MFSSKSRTWQGGNDEKGCPLAAGIPRLRQRHRAQTVFVRRWAGRTSAAGTPRASCTEVQITAIIYGLAYEEIGIRTGAGKQLYAWWLPIAEPAPILIVLHGWAGNAGLMLPLALPIHRAELNILLHDARNHGRSDSASLSPLPWFAEDAGAAADWVKARGGDPRKRAALLGHSVGAGAVLFEASRRDDISAAVSIAAFAHPEWMMRRYLDRFRMPDLCKSMDTSLRRMGDRVSLYRDCATGR